jgi:uncharacterized protein (TIGR02996 family)
MADQGYDELVAAVFARPEDDGPRLVLADYLTERNDPRGDFINLQCTLAGSANPQRRLDLRAKERALLAAHEGEWAQGLEVATAFRFRRGFVEGVRALATKFFASPQLMDAHPIIELELHGVTAEHLALIAAAPWLARIRSLQLGGYYGDAISLLAASPHLGALRRLNLGYNSLVSADGIRALVAAPGLRLEMLTVKGAAAGDEDGGDTADEDGTAGASTIGDVGATLIAEAPSMANLRELYVGMCNISNAGAQAIAGSPYLKNLTTLSLRQNKIYAAGARALVGSAYLRGLRLLELTGNPLGPDALEILKGATATFPAMTRLVVGDIGLDWKGMGELKKAWGRRLRNAER